MEPSSSPVQSANELSGVNLNYLIADRKTPCAVYLFFQGKFIEYLKADQVVSLAHCVKIRTEFYSSGFIHQNDREIWQRWKIDRHVQNEKIICVDSDALASKKNALGQKQKIGVANYIAYALSKIQFQTNGEAERAQLEKVEEVFKAVASNKIIEWYFLKPPSEELLCHSARVTYLALLFATLGLATPPSRETVITLTLASIIHELEGNPCDRTGRCVSVRTQELIAQARHPVPQPVTEVLKQHDELFNGKGAPRGLKGEAIGLAARIFALANNFDHFRLMNLGGTRRMRFKRVQEKMAAKSSEYDPVLWTQFFVFMEKIEFMEGA